MQQRIIFQVTVAIFNIQNRLKQNIYLSEQLILTATTVLQQLNEFLPLEKQTSEKQKQSFKVQRFYIQ
jgi:hypothetical protein